MVPRFFGRAKRCRRPVAASPKMKNRSNLTIKRAATPVNFGPFLGFIQPSILTGDAASDHVFADLRRLPCFARTRTTRHYLGQQCRRFRDRPFVEEGGVLAARHFGDNARACGRVLRQRGRGRHVGRIIANG